MKKTGAELAVFALEQVGVKFTFGIPGVHNTEVYDCLNNSSQIQPVLVTHEGGGAFMADAISRTTDSIGTIVVVPAAGIAHAMSGIGEAYLDGIPMLVVSGGTRRDSGKQYQLHQMDQQKLVAGITKAAFVIEEHKDIIPTIYKAYEIATSDEPGPVLVEIPAELQLFRGEVSEMQNYQRQYQPPQAKEDAILKAVEEIKKAKRPCLFVGWGAVDASEELIQLAELLEAPVSTSLQGLSAFPATHPLHTGMSFGPCGPPAAEKTFADCDCLIAVGVRFGELATGSFSVTVPESLIHIDINPEVFDKNYPTKVAIHSDSKLALQSLIQKLQEANFTKSEATNKVREIIQKEKQAYFAKWRDKKNSEKVSPGIFFEQLRKQMADDDFLLTDDGNHTFLAAEQYAVHQSRRFISPTDFNCMGYCVPATIATKLANPEKRVVGIVGDGAFLMTGLETITATSLSLGPVFFVFYDGELGQISQFQKIPLNEKTCTILGQVKLEGVAIATGAKYLEMKNDSEIEEVIQQAFAAADQGQPVIVDVKIDYSKKTRLTTGAVKTNLGRFPLGEKCRFIGRAVYRHITANASS